jgi:hypothetical protein
MNVLYIIGGLALLIFGIWLTVIKARNISRGRKSVLGSDIQLIIAGIASIICGIIIIWQNI